jgi:carbamoyl-phosphate synthase large subunit
VRANIPCITTVQGLGAAVHGIEALHGDVGVKPLQEWTTPHRDALRVPPGGDPEKQAPR